MQEKRYKAAVPAEPWPGSELAAEAGRQRGQGWPAVAL